LAPDLGKALRIEQQKLLDTASELRKRREATDKDLLTYANGETDTLLKELIAAGVDPGVVTPEDELIAEAREHYWVRYGRSGTGWTDLDASNGGPDPGKARATAEDHFPANAVPEDRYHHLRLTVTLRTAQVEGDHDGSLRDAVILDKEIRVADQQGTGIVLANQPYPAYPVSDMIARGKTLGDMLTQTKGYQVILQIGSSISQGKYFGLDGKVSDRPEAAGGPPAGSGGSPIGGFGQALGGLSGGLLGGLGGAGPASPKQIATRVVGEWVDYSISSPGPRDGNVVNTKYRRDIVPPERVTSWSPSGGPPAIVPTRLDNHMLAAALLWSVNLLPAVDEGDFDYVGQEVLISTLNMKAHVDKILRATSGMDVGELAPPAAPAPILSVALDAMVASRTMGPVEHSGIRWYRSQPDLIGYETGIDATGDHMPFERLDMVHLVPRAANLALASGEAKSRTAYDRIFHGVLAAELEDSMLRPQSGSPNTDGRVVLTSGAPIKTGKE
jgi:hypothetical protein